MTNALALSRTPKLGQTIPDIVKGIVESIKPELKDLVASAAQAAEPTIQKVVREEVMPKVTLGLVVGMIGTAGVAAVIGSLFARGRASSRMSGLGFSGSQAAGGGLPSSLSGLTEELMTQKSVGSPPVRAKAANGNLVRELREDAKSLADDLARKRAAGLAGPAYRPGNPTAGLALGRALVEGPVSAGGMVGGALAGVPTYFVTSRILLQNVLGANERVGDGVTAAASLVLHFFARTSFTLGFATSLTLPIVADLIDYAMTKTGVGSIGLSGTKPQQKIASQQKPQSVAGFRQNLLTRGARVA